MGRELPNSDKIRGTGYPVPGFGFAENSENVGDKLNRIAYACGKSLADKSTEFVNDLHQKPIETLGTVTVPFVIGGAIGLLSRLPGKLKLLSPIAMTVTGGLYLGTQIERLDKCGKTFGALYATPNNIEGNISDLEHSFVPLVIDAAVAGTGFGTCKLASRLKRSVNQTISKPQEAILKAKLSWTERKHGSWHCETTNAQLELANFYNKTGNLHEAQKWLDKSNVSVTKLSETLDPSYFQSHHQRLTTQQSINLAIADFRYSQGARLHKLDWSVNAQSKANQLLLSAYNSYGKYGKFSEQGYGNPKLARYQDSMNKALELYSNTYDAIPVKHLSPEHAQEAYAAKLSGALLRPTSPEARDKLAQFFYDCKDWDKAEAIIHLSLAEQMTGKDSFNIERTAQLLPRMAQCLEVRGLNSLGDEFRGATQSLYMGIYDHLWMERMGRKDQVYYKNCSPNLNPLSQEQFCKDIHSLLCQVPQDKVAHFLDTLGECPFSEWAWGNLERLAKPASALIYGIERPPERLTAESTHAVLSNPELKGNWLSQTISKMASASYERRAWDEAEALNYLDVLEIANGSGRWSIDFAKNPLSRLIDCLEIGGHETPVKDLRNYAEQVFGTSGRGLLGLLLGPDGTELDKHKELTRLLKTVPGDKVSNLLNSLDDCPFKSGP